MAKEIDRKGFVAASFTVLAETRVGIIGCDTSHAVAFARLWYNVRMGVWFCVLTILLAGVSFAAPVRTILLSTADGLPTCPVTGIVELDNGHLVAFTPAGDVRFDGLDFHPHVASPEEKARVTSSLVGRDGVRWKASPRGLVIERPQAVFRPEETDGLVGRSFRDGAGCQWFVGPGNTLVCRTQNGSAWTNQFERMWYGGVKGVFREHPAGTVWLLTQRRIVAFPVSEFREAAEGRREDFRQDVFGNDDGFSRAERHVPRIDDSEVRRMAELPTPQVMIDAPREKRVFAPETPLIAFTFSSDFPGLANRMVYEARLLPMEPDFTPVRGRRIVTYRYLPYGDYRVEVRARLPFGQWGPVETRSFSVRPKLSENPWVKGVSLLLLLLLVGGTVRYVIVLRVRWRLEKMQRFELLAAERGRISRDIHEDVGARLTRISLLLGLACGARPSKEMAEISDEVRGVVRTLDEVVWAIEPRNDTLENVIDYILRYTEDYLVASGLRLRFSSPLESPEVVVGSKVRHAFVMAYKEALNNLVKHASARTVYLGFEIASKGLVVVLGDDGCGFTAGRPGGNGLKNMSARLAEVGGRFEIGSRDDGGTVVRLSVPLDGGGGKS